MNVGSTLKANANANANTTKIVQPCVSTLDHPAEFAESAAVFRTVPGDHRFDTARAKPLTMWLGVIATLCADDMGLQSGRPRTPQIGGIASMIGSNWVTSLRFAPVRMVLIGGAIGVGVDVMLLELGRERSVGLGPVFRPPQRLAPRMNRPPPVRNRVRRPRVTSRAAVRATRSTQRTAQAEAVVQGLFACKVGEIEPVLHEVNPQHALERNRRASTAAFRIKQLQHSAKLRLGHDRVHLIEKRFASRRFALRPESRALIDSHRQCQLFHRFTLSLLHARTITHGSHERWT